MRYLIIGDTHFSQRKPQNRKENWLECIYFKLEKIKSILDKEKFDYVILLGDIFGRKDISFPFLSNIINYFFEIKKRVKKILFIPGNHDLFYGLPDSWKEAPLGVLSAINLMEYIDFLEDSDGAAFYFYGFGKPIKEVNHSDILKICIAHCFYNFPFSKEESLFTEDVIKLGYDFYILGHDHSVYEKEVINDKGRNIYILRFGALMRTAMNQNDMNRDVFVLDFSIKDRLVQINPINLGVSKDVFLTGNLIDKEKKDFSEVLRELFVYNIKSYDSDKTLKEKLEEIKKSNEDLFFYIKNILLNKGINI